MKKQPYRQSVILVVLSIFALSFVPGCSGGPDLPAQISGSWQRSEGGGTVEIDLVGKPPSLTVDGQAYPATILKVDKGARSVFLTVKTPDGQTEEWILAQVWSDNGGDFSVALIHNGTREVMLPAKRS